MHELGITQEIVEIAARRAGGARVLRIVLEVGELGCVSPDSLRFCFEVCAKDTPVEGAVLEVVTIPGEARCRACEEVFALDRPFGACACGSTDLEVRKGEELRLREMEVAACA